MNISVEKIRDDRQMRALTGLSIAKFEQLLEPFSQVLARQRQADYEAGLAAGTRQRKPGGGAKGKLPLDGDKLYFILYYLKSYPTFDLVATHFNMARSKAHANVYKYWPLLSTTLRELGVVPQRQFDSLEEFQHFCRDLETLLIDATERPYRRPQEDQTQRQYYSGKKKRHALKNTLIGDSSKRIVYLGPTTQGSTHDYTMFKAEFEPSQPWFAAQTVYVDLGYLGIRTAYDAPHINVPHRKPRKSAKNPEPQLSEQQKADNRRLSQVRVLIENAIAGVKRYRIVVDRFRNHLKDAADHALETVSALWNLYLLET